ncbi:MAR-binding filament-like protein 1 [Phthorimaea operculella]|nr:MAR-binding filament-like protein 1 [Phthorimaea operculella]
MATNVKSPKDCKPKPARLVPRPTAASAARAAQNAKNRNLNTQQPGIRETPSNTRGPTSPIRKAMPVHTAQSLATREESMPRQAAHQPLAAKEELIPRPTANLPLTSKAELIPRQIAHQPLITKAEQLDKFLIQDNTVNPVHLKENVDSIVTGDTKDNLQQDSYPENHDIVQPNNNPEIADTVQPHNNPDNVQPFETIIEQNDEPERTQNYGTSETSDGSALGVRTPSRPQTPNSRPTTPRISSHPVTPKSRSRTPSRPTTPARPTSRASSRPTTPSTVATPSNVTTPSTIAAPSTLHRSRPTTPQKSATIGSRNLPSSIPVSLTRTPPVQQHSVSPVEEEEEDIKSVFAIKQKQFHRMKKELDIKQQAVLDLFDNLRNLNERLVKEGSGEGVQFQQMVVLNVGDWTSEEITQLCRDATATNNENAIDFIGNLKPIDEDALCALDAQVSSIPSKFAELCLQAFTARQELIDWIKILVEPMEDGRGESFEKIAQYNNEGIELCDTLRQLKARADDAVDTIAQIARCALRERSTLLNVGESLVRETARLRADLDSQAVIVNELRQMQAQKEASPALDPQELQELRNQLEEERTARVAAKEKQTLAESQLRQSRARVTKMDRQLKEAEATIVSLTASVKALEDQNRQREVQLEARARKLKESLKTGEVTQTQIAQQRDALQAEVKMLKEQIATLMATNQAAIHDYNKEIKELKVSLDNQEKETEQLIENNKVLQQNLTESLEMIETLKAKIPDENENTRELPTEKEMDLWSELQATKEMLQLTEDEVTACKREKVRFLETLTKISESENKIGMQQKLAAELLSKEEIIGKMQIQIRDLTKNIKLYEQKVAQYEHYVCDLQAHNRAAAENNGNTNEPSYQEWQQEIMNLKMSLLDAVHMNEKLTEVLSQKEQQLEQQDKTSRNQARIIKVREELINMLKNKETEQSKELSALQQDLESRMKIVDDVNKQIAAKAEEIQELFATLENKQQQIHRLEKIVLALEEQQRRAQAQRMRHEEKIAALEHELAATNRRERKFLFF